MSKNKSPGKTPDERENCIIYNENVNMDFEVYSMFESEFNDFFNSNSKIDILHFTSWSGGRASQYSRLYINKNDSMFICSSNEGIVSSKEIDSSLSMNVQVEENLSTLKIAQLCRNYRSVSFVSFYFIKTNGVLIFKYYVDSSNYNELDNKDKKKIEKQIEILRLVDKYAPHYYPSSPCINE